MPTVYQTYDGSREAGASGRWIQSIHDVFGGVDIRIDDPARFRGTIRSVLLASVELNTVGCSNEDATRSRRHVAADNKASHALSFVLSGHLHLEQRERACDVGPGDFVLFDLNAPYRHQHAGWTDVLSIKVPSAMLEARLSGLQRYVGRVGSAQRGIGRVTRDALAALAEEAPAIPEPIASSTIARMIDLVAILLEADDADLPIADSCARSALYHRIVGFVEAHLGDPALDARAIAAAQGISVRYLHRIFQDTGVSVGAFVRERRLARCHQDLQRTDGRRLSIKDVAFRAGFTSQAHFASTFRRRYQMSPSDVARASRYADAVLSGSGV